MRPRRGMGRTALLGVMALVLVLVIAGVFVVIVSGNNKSSTTKASTGSKTSNTTTSPSVTTTCTLEPASTISVCTTIGGQSSTDIGYNLSQPLGDAYDPANGDLYVTNNASASVSVINVAGDKYVTTIPVGNNPAQAVYDSVNNQVYVTNNSSSTVTAINGTTNTVIATIQTAGLQADGIVFDPDNNLLYVMEHGNGVGGEGVTIINATTDSLVRGIQGIWQPTAGVFDPVNKILYATTGGSTVMVINTTTNELTSQISVQSDPAGIALDPTNGYLYIANVLSGTVSVIDTGNNSVIATINVSGSVLTVPYLCAYDPANGEVMVTNDYSSGVDVINGTTLVGGVSGVVNTGFQSEPAGLTYDSTDQMMYVVDHAISAVVGITPTLTPSYLAAPSGAVVSSTSASQTAVNFGP